MNNKTRDFIQKNIGYISVALVCIVYIAASFIIIGKSGKTIEQIIADGFIAFALGFTINRIFDTQGIINGERDERYIATLKLHSEMIDKVSPHIDMLSDWCEIQNKANLKLQRTRILATEGLKYDDYFDDEGNAKGYEYTEKKLPKNLQKIEDAKISCYRKAVKLKLTPLSAGELTSEGSKANDTYDFGRTKAQYEKEASVSDIVSKVIVAFIFGYFGVSFIATLDMANLIWHCLQVAMFIGMGAITMYKSFTFITDEYRGRIIKKINNLEMFYNYILKGENTDAK